jgi:hypothetical protein
MNKKAKANEQESTTAVTDTDVVADTAAEAEVATTEVVATDTVETETVATEAVATEDVSATATEAPAVDNRVPAPVVETVVLPDGQEITPGEAAVLDKTQKPAGAWFVDEDDFITGTYVIDDGIHRPEHIHFVEPSETLTNDIEALPQWLAEKLGITQEQARDQEWLNANIDFDKALPVARHMRELYQRIRHQTIKGWSFEREVSKENIDKLPSLVKQRFGEHVVNFVLGGEADGNFFPK